jgi:hypothetical protein
LPKAILLKNKPDFNEKNNKFEIELNIKLSLSDIKKAKEVLGLKRVSELEFFNLLLFLAKGK